VKQRDIKLAMQTATDNRLLDEGETLAALHRLSPADGKLVEESQASPRSGNAS
jgi:hypothetical protein